MIDNFEDPVIGNVPDEKVQVRELEWIKFILILPSYHACNVKWNEIQSAKL